MEKYTIEEVALPERSLVEQAFSHIHYADAYKVTLPNELVCDVDSISRLFLASSPSWVARLMKIRDKLVNLIGLKTSKPADLQHITFEPGSQVGIFRVINRSANEIVMGEDDRHLDFRVSILLEDRNGMKCATVSTTVYYHNWLGRLYFFIVGRVHKLIVPSMLKSMMRNV
ncbi:DUF2867 domain-containing protein [Aneurinibacillus uraniidurans]|uniref:DUF2867 domain-containing protein n=1 Tax=Aneurinibacillus uraniidurans TaxID=2966586 RepID=UPI00234BE90B|nr:DUF2867 domain-containing protein [Aneurinibacillus sp. B1]WCN39432.1 DUF2867 domain-containing protein [Aneurinibacillus sp. B1]